MTVSDNSQQSQFNESVLQISEASSNLPATRSIEIRGDVRRPGEFTYKKEADIFHYLNLAGGAVADVRCCNIIVVRQYGDKRRSLLFRLDQKEYLPRIRRGDLIIITDLGEDRKAPRQFHKPAISPPIQKNTVRPRAADYESSLPSRGQALKKTINDYIRFPQFKRLLNQIASHQAATGTKSIAVLSSESAEGKSSFCASLALAYASFLDSQVLIIDSNRDETLRSPDVVVVKGDYSSQVPNQERHSEAAFVDLVSVSEIEREYHENTDFYFSPYINSVKSNHDLVIVDTCAIRDVPKSAVDPMIISSQVDGVIILNSPKSLDKKSLERLASELKSSGARIIGTVYNSFLQK